MMRLANEVKVGKTKKEAEEYIGMYVRVHMIDTLRPTSGNVIRVDDEFLYLEHTPLLLSYITKIEDLGEG